MYSWEFGNWQFPYIDEKKTYLFDTNHMQTCPLIQMYADHVIKLR